jgi:hypothetical protein
MIDPVYECCECLRLLMACPRCGRALHYGDELHLDFQLRWCAGSAPVEVNGMEIHPALIRPRQLARDALAQHKAKHSGAKS